ncbi:MAG: hypothetical protein IPK97_20930 [Ahniella sp.]|nr:hypothetical protein [Ahniella sp.]
MRPLKHCTILAAPIFLLAGQTLAETPLDGIQDLSFGGNGLASISFNLAAGHTDDAQDVVVSPSGSIYMAATVGISVQVRRGGGSAWPGLLADGRLDNTFSSDGLSSPSPAALNEFHAEARGLAVRADGKPIVAGFRYSTNLEGKILVCRFNVAGNLDSTFDSDGCAEPTLALIDNGGEFAKAVVAMPQDRILVAGHVAVNPLNTNHSDGLLLMLNSDGSIANGFGTQGHVLVRPPVATMTFVQDVEVLPDGRLLAFGRSDVSSFVARFDANGLIDTSYGVDGYALFDFGDLHMLSNPEELLADGAVDAEGRAYWCGNVRSDFNIALSVLALARLTPAGMLDPAYSGDGRFLAPFIDVLQNSNVAACKIDTQGRLVVAANPGTDAPLNGDFGALRLGTDGLPDLSFNSIGQTRVSIDLGGNGVGHDEISGMALMGDSVFLAGTSHPVNGFSQNEKLIMVRLATDRTFADGFGLIRWAHETQESFRVRRACCSIGRASGK